MPRSVMSWCSILHVSAMTYMEENFFFTPIAEKSYSFFNNPLTVTPLRVYMGYNQLLDL